MRPRAAGFVFAGVLLLVCVATSSRAVADPPDVHMQVGVRVSSYTGEVGRLSARGLGLTLSQGVQLGLVGGYLRIGTDYRLTTQEGPPSAHGMQTYEVAAGLRVAPAWSLVGAYPSVGIEFASLGVLANPLTAQTGGRVRHNGLGLNLAARRAVGDLVYAELAMHTQFVPTMTGPAPWVAGTVSLGIGLAGAR